MRILGVDPGTWHVGWAVIDAHRGQVRLVEFGCVSAPRSAKAIEKRAGIIFQGLDEVIRKHAPECMAIEEAFFGKNVKAALRIGEGRGFAIACAAMRSMAVHEYSPTAIKKSAVGTGSAHKSQVAEMMRRALGLKTVPEPEHAADALAAAWCHANRG